MTENTGADTVLDSICERLEIAQGSSADDILAEIQKRAAAADGPNDADARQALTDMLDDFQKKLDQVPAGRRIEQPTDPEDEGDGDAPTSRSFQRYLDSCGASRGYAPHPAAELRRLPEAARARAFLELPAERDDARRRALQEMNDELLILDTIMRESLGGGYQGMRSLGLFAEFQRELGAALRAIDTQTSGQGSQWVPTGFSADFWEHADAKAIVAPLLPQVTIPRGMQSLTLPGLTGHVTAYKQAERTADEAAKMTASTPTSANRTLTPVKIAVRTLISVESDEDMVTPILGMIRSDCMSAVAKGRDDCIINGDTSATHQDSDVTSANDVRKCWNGFRKSALTANKVDLSTFTLENVASLRKKLNLYGEDPSELFWLCSVINAVDLMLLEDSSGNLVNAAQIVAGGTGRPIERGAVGTLLGSPIIQSGKVRTNLNASGVYDGTTTDNSVLILTNRNCWVRGEKREVTLKTDEIISTDQVELVVTWRGDFKCRQDATSESVVALGYDVSTA